MSKTKSKNDVSPRNEQAGFVWIWVISYVALWFVMWFPIDWRLNPYVRNDSSIIHAPMILFTVLLMSLLQWRVTQRVLRQSMRAWIPVSLLGSVFSLVAFSITPRSSGLFVSVLSLILPIAVTQALWLSRRVRAAWLWPTASVISVLFFTLPFRDYDSMRTSNASLMPLMLGLGIAQGIIQSVVMRHLWLHTGETEKPKQQSLIEDLESQETLARLTLDESAQDIIDAEPLLQQHSSQ